MKQYKLIKKYPSLPKDWEVGMLVGHGDRQSSSYYSPCSIQFTDRKICHTEVVNHPECWQEVVEKDYEILSFQLSTGIATKQPDGRFKDAVQFTEEVALEQNLKIHSVKRLSDGEVFTVGDRIRHNNKVSYPEGIITKLHIVSDMLFVETNNKEKGFDTNISLVHKIHKKPLFTTEDGVEIFEDDNYYGVNKFLRIFSNNGEYFTAAYLENGSKRFSTKEAAEEYIMLNKPCLSYKDFEALWLQSVYSDQILKSVKNLVKYKNNGQ